MRIAVFSLALLSAFAIPAAARADILHYSFSTADYNLSGTFDLNTTAGFPAAQGSSTRTFAITSATGGFVSDTSVTFYQPGSDSIDFGATGLLFQGQQLYFGATPTPTFFIGHANLTNLDSGDPVTLDVTNLTTAATPEPSSLMLVGTAVLGMAGALRRRSRAV